MIGMMLDNKRNGTVGDAISPHLKKAIKYPLWLRYLVFMLMIFEKRIE